MGLTRDVERRERWAARNGLHDRLCHSGRDPRASILYIQMISYAARRDQIIIDLGNHFAVFWVVWET